MTHVELRDYQITGVDDIRDAFRRGVKRPLYVLPTGAGKTILFSYIAREAAARGKRVCILLHRRELLIQTCHKLEYPHGIIANGFTPNLMQNIQVASVQTIVNRLDLYEFDLLVVDEAHHSKAETWMRVIGAYPDALTLGVTATPVRQDGKGLGDIFKELIVGPSVQELTDEGYLAPAEVYAPSVIDTTGIRSQMGDFIRKELSAAVDKPTITGDAIAHYKKYANGLPAIAFCVSVEHAQSVADQFKARHISAKMVCGKTDACERDDAINALAHGDLDVLTSCDLISEGVDVPVVACGIMLRPTQSMGLAMQQMGRILRPSPGKDAAIILDHAGNCLRHGLPSESREWSLDGRTAKGKRDAMETIRVRQCERCFYVHAPAPSCPKCGFVYPLQSREVEEREGELQKIEADQLRTARKKEVRRARSREALEAIAEERGYKPGWVNAVMRYRGQQGPRRKEAGVV